MKLHWKRAALALGLVLNVTPVMAQTQAPALNETQIEGRRLFFQHCGICHARRGANAGPPLYGALIKGNEAGYHEVIAIGTPRMPGFRYMFKPADIDAILSYLSTLPKPPDPVPGALEGSPAPAD